MTRASVGTGTRADDRPARRTTRTGRTGRTTRTARRAGRTPVGPLDGAARTSHRWVTALVAAVALRSIAPSALNFLHLPHLSTEVADVVARHPWATVASTVLTAVVAVLSLVMVARAAGSLQGRVSTLLMFLGFPALVLATSWVRRGFDVGQVADSVTTALVLVALWTARVDRRALGALAVVGSSVALYSMALALVDPQAAYFGTQTGELGQSTKAVIGDDQLAGPFGHSNTLGVTMALSLPFMVFLRRRWTRYGGVVAVLVALLWSASRTSMIAVAVVLVGVALTAAVSGFARRALAASLLVSGWLAVVLLPFVVVDVGAFTSRGAIWQGSLAAWRSDPVLGQGFDWYSSVAGFRNDLGRQASSGHNLLVTLLATGGLVAVLLAGVLAARLSRLAYRTCANGGGVAVLWYVATFAWISTLEAVWEVQVGSELYVVVGFAMALLVRAHEDAPDAAPVPAASRARPVGRRAGRPRARGPVAAR